MQESSGFQVGRDAPAFYEAHSRLFMAPFVESLVAATVSAGDAVLDVACGTGFATRSAAALAGAGARVDGSDINPAMLDVARSVADDSGAHLNWTEASALDLPFADDEFDAVICQQGLQFFPDPSAGVREMTRVAKRGAQVGVTVWAPAEQSPFLHGEAELLNSEGTGPAAEFSTTETQLRDWFVGAGHGEVTIELLRFEVDLPPVIEYVREHLKALPWSASFFEHSDTQQHEAFLALDHQLAEYRIADGIRVPFTSFLATVTV